MDAPLKVGDQVIVVGGGYAFTRAGSYGVVTHFDAIPDMGEHRQHAHVLFEYVSGGPQFSGHTFTIRAEHLMLRSAFSDMSLDEAVVYLRVRERVSEAAESRDG